LEIEKKVGEVIAANFVETYPPGSYTKYLPPIFLGTKNDTRTNPMVGNNVKLNKRTKAHVVLVHNGDNGGTIHQKNI